MAEGRTSGSETLAVIEVRGMLDAATVVDSMFKAAVVKHERSLRVGSGWIAIWISGDVNGVNTAVDSAYRALPEASDARSCVFTLPSDAIRRFMMTPVAA